MESRAKLLGHPMHQMLIVFPLGLLGMAVIFDLISIFGGSRDWTFASYYMIGAGILTGLLAAIFGFIDYRAIPAHTRAKNVGALHGVANVIVLGFFAISWFLRDPNPYQPGGLAYLCGFAGFGVALFSGWLGGELVDRLGVGVDEGAHLNAPSSLRSRSARPSEVRGL